MSGMMMARPSTGDLEAAQALCGLLEQLSDGYIDDETPFDQDDGDLCRQAMQQILQLCEGVSLFRVVFGMATLCDPRNELIDPDGSVLALHPRLRALAGGEPSAAGGAS